MTGEGIGRLSLMFLVRCMGLQGIQLSGVSRLQGISQLGQCRFTGQAVILLVNRQVKGMKWPLFNVFFIHSVAKLIVLQQFAQIFFLFFVAIKIFFYYLYLLSSLVSVDCKFRTINKAHLCVSDTPKILKKKRKKKVLYKQHWFMSNKIRTNDCTLISIPAH